jgi:ketosteroid isomerase-like protein
MHFRRFASVAVAAGLVAGLMTPVLPSTQDDIMAPVHQFVNGFNKGDTKTAFAACASPAAIIDDIPPHHWQGLTACADWGTSYAAAAKQDRITDGLVTMGKPWHVYVDGDTGYVVVPVTYTYKQNGKPMKESGSVFTVALKKTSVGWRIAGWTWSQH